ncbi:dTDP-4-dehydrorhamnose reductase [Kaistia dalseonensis]|uniref:dTDP-4-dehydrorhamnose reductase n=1 Tax=Kaistia dalseonensis TaxID=410840 RepID=A0ABU0H7H2_9HYPH|nr:dTDP-4-dehydrorhamnose reductase [Kaistia dalseonensis]MCX5495669.1 dTDP-4-dehydrorhamnose reductase [Kaistia dalseonensis]MDQ0438263.1 dTDP-4-dehydrorhamnose reductase [Kaistia dalseonensis]
MPAPILVFGRSGQVARRLIATAAERSIPLVALGRPEIDIADGASIADAIERLKPAVIINAAAHTAVDFAESEPDAAMAINADAPRHMAEGAALNGIPFLHISTDYVFDGAKVGAYVETDATNPLSVYGRSKRSGEEAVMAAHGDGSAIFRTSWVYDSEGKNFLRTMLRLAADRPSLKVVDDQFGAPTPARLIAETLLDIADNVVRNGFQDRTGLYHLVASGETSWNGFAKAIFAEAAARGLPSAEVLPIATVDYPTPAVRPKNSRLSTERLQRDYGLAMPDWRVGLAICMDEIAAVTPKAESVNG